MGKRNTYYPSTNHTVKSTGEEILTQERKKTMKEFLTFVNNVIYQGARAHTHGKKTLAPMVTVSLPSMLF